MEQNTEQVFESFNAIVICGRFEFEFAFNLILRAFFQIEFLD